MGRIAVLPPSLQAQIAAGEVVERPASVVRELVENALDAGARRIDVQLTGGGLERIVVRDDGEGMSPQDALLAFSRHATSKLVRLDDLSSVATWGFRGEALPSIAAVARVTLTTRRPTDPTAHRIATEAGAACDAGPTGAPPGTSVDVQNLFAAVPARRKFLRTVATEVAHVSDVITRLAVAAPGVSFRLSHDGRTPLDLPAVRSLRERLTQILGSERGRALVELKGPAGAVAVSGLLGPPREALSSARLLWTYVRIGEGAARWVRDRLLTHAVLDGYESLLMKGRYPIAIVFVTLQAGEIDVNVHPAKLEVRFRSPSVVHQLVAPAIRRCLGGALRPGESAPASSAGSVGEGIVAYLPEAPGEPMAADDAGAARLVTPMPARAVLLEPATQSALWQPSPEGFASLRFIGQFFEGYLLCEGSGRVVLIDQHAAHERVLFEALRTSAARSGVARDPLLVPETVTLGPAEVAALAEHGALLESAGLEGEPFGEDTYLLRTVPHALRGQDAGSLLRAIAADLVDRGASQAAARARDDLLATLACHAAVRVGQRLEGPRVHALLEAMDRVDVNAHCPHGRPVAVALTRARVEALFGR